MTFRKSDTDEKGTLLDELRGLRADIKGLRKERDAEARANSAQDEINRLKREIADLEVKKSQITEQHAREKRETEHMVGLQKKRSEFEQEAAKRDAVLTVREENLQADKDRLQEQVTFLQGRFEAEVGYLKELMGEVLSRLPDVQVEGTLPARRPTRKAS